MKIGITIPDKFLPRALRSDTKAVEKFTQNLGKKKRVVASLTQRRQFIVKMRQDELKQAIRWAEDPDRPRRELLYDMYKVTLRDASILGEYEKAINKVIGSPFGVFKVGASEVDEQATRLLQRDWFEQYRHHFEEARFWGHSLVQFIGMKPSLEKGLEAEFSEIELIPREHVRPEEGYIVLDVSHETGLPFRDETLSKNLRLIEMGERNNLGILCVIAKNYIWKNYSFADWSRHSEKFGMPLLAIKAATTDKDEIDKLEQMAQKFGNDLYIILDPEDEVELKESMSSAGNAHKIYLDMIRIQNEEVAKAVVWQTGSTEQKAYVGAAEVHERVLNDYVEARKRKQTYHVNAVLFPFLIEHGYPLQGKEFRYLTYSEANPEQAQQQEQNRNGNDQSGGGGSTKKSGRPSPSAFFR